MADAFTIAGSTVNLDSLDGVSARYSERFGEIPSLTLQRRGIALPGLSDPWLGKAITWTDTNGVLRFVGDVVSAVPSFEAIGWVITYQCLGLRNRADWLPHTDGNTGLDSSPFNCPLEDTVNYQAARAGRTVGQVLASVLTMLANANGLNAVGIGQYTGLPTAPVLPALTLADLAATGDMQVIPPKPVYVNGESLGGAIEGLCAQYAPNTKPYIQPDGTYRFIDISAMTPHTLTLDVDPIEPTELTRDWGSCWPRVEVRGAPLAVMFLWKQSTGQLQQNFAWGSNSNAQAITAWTKANFQQPGSSQDTGTCTCPSTTTVTVTSSNATYHWPANFWDQTSTGAQGTVNVWYTAGAGITQQWTSRIISNTALVAGGTSTLTIQVPMPITSYNRYSISGLAIQGPSIVWRKYKINDTSLWPLVTNQSSYPQAVVNAGGGVSLMSTMMGVVLWGTAGAYNMFPLAVTYDGAGNFYFAAPTYLFANNAAPADVWVYAPVNTGQNTVFSPQNSGGSPVYSGTSHTVEGISTTKVATVSDWRDPGQAAQVQAYADSLQKSLRDTVVQGDVTYLGLYANALTFGMALNVAGGPSGATYSTGWESSSLPAGLAVLGVDLAFNFGPSEATSYTTTLHCSNRRGQYSVDVFMQPPRQLEGYTFGADSGGNPFGISQPDFGAEASAASAGPSQTAGTSGPADLGSFTPGAMQAPDLGSIGPGDLSQQTPDLGSRTPDLGSSMPDLGGGSEASYE